MPFREPVAAKPLGSTRLAAVHMTLIGGYRAIHVQTHYRPENQL
jgi:hypothetical protein